MRTFLAAVITLICLYFPLNSQNITNKLGANGNFIVTDATSTPQYLIIEQGTGNIGIGSNDFDPENPERLLIDCGTTSSVNAIYAKGTLNNYFQFNIRNLSGGDQSSSDICATANNGSESNYYIDVGINGSGYVWQPGNSIEFGNPNDCYLLGKGNTLYIANSNSTKDIVFLVGGTASSNERMRIRYNGRVGIGVSNPSYLLQLNGGAYCTGTNWYNGSDRALKRDINDLTKYGIEDVMKMRPVTYYFKSDSTNKLEVGFIAQEMKDIIPEVVLGEEGSMGISYGNLVPVLVNAIKQQQEQIDMLKKINGLTNSNSSIQSAGFEGVNSTPTILSILALAAGVIAITLNFRHRQRRIS